MITVEEFNRRGEGRLPGLLGLVVTRIAPNELHAERAVLPHHLGPYGDLHAGSVVTLADTCAGDGCVAHLPEGATGFTTLELKSRTIALFRCTQMLIHGRAA